jgi:murein DD-endopeptidase MepM/ murein hydrolase activator NlpD
LVIQKVATLTLAAVVFALNAIPAAAQGPGASLDDDTPTLVLSKDRAPAPSTVVRAADPKRPQLAPIGVEEHLFEANIPAGSVAEIVPAPPRLVAMVNRSKFGAIPINSKFGLRRDPITGSARMHTGVDLKATYGRSVGASLGGKVLYAGHRGGYGNLVILDHGKGISTFYAHLSQISVTVGQRVAMGQSVGRVGSTGRSTGPHLHYEVRAQGAPLDPSALITFQGKSIFANGRLVSGPAIEGGDEVVAKAKDGKPAPPEVPLAQIFEMSVSEDVIDGQ